MTETLGLREWLREYNETILPMREEADAGRGSYQNYDEAYNEHLEDLHLTIKQADLNVLDNAHKLREWVKRIARMETEEEMDAQGPGVFSTDDHLEALNNLIVDARGLLTEDE